MDVYRSYVIFDPSIYSMGETHLKIVLQDIAILELEKDK
jgi:hypothetical protein